MKCKGSTDDGRMGGACGHPNARNPVEERDACRSHSSIGHFTTPRTGGPTRKGLEDASSPHVLRLGRLQSWLQTGLAEEAEEVVGEAFLWAVPRWLDEHIGPPCRG
jgi:hypothetical protein